MPGTSNIQPKTPIPATYDWSLLSSQWGEWLQFGELTFHVMRHGQTVLNAKGLVTGSMETDLTPEGLEQARLVATDLEPPYDLAVSSMMRRANHTLVTALACAG